MDSVLRITGLSSTMRILFFIQPGIPALRIRSDQPDTACVLSNWRSGFRRLTDFGFAKDRIFRHARLPIGAAARLLPNGQHLLYPGAGEVHERQCALST